MDRMKTISRLAVPDGTLDDDEFALARQYLLEVGFIRQEKGNYVFSHQTLYDYCYARRFVAKGESISEVILNSFQGLFERSQLVQVMAHLRVSDAQKYLVEMQSLLLATSLRPHLRILLIEWFASVIAPSNDERELAKQLMQYEQDYIAFLLSARGNIYWFDKLNDGYIASRLAGTPSSRTVWTLATFLGSIISKRRQQILRLLLPYQNLGDEWDAIIGTCLSSLEDWNDN
jgi:hypothetical protein